MSSISAVALLLGLAGCAAYESQLSAPPSPAVQVPDVDESPSSLPRPTPSAEAAAAQAPSPTVAVQEAQRVAEASPALPAPSLSPVPVPKLTSAPKGYAFGAAPAAVIKALGPIAAGHEGVLSAPVVRSVTRTKEPLGSVAMMAVEPSHLADREVTAALLSRFVAGMTGEGYTVRTRSVTAGGAKHSVQVATRKGSTIAAWIDRGCVLTLVSTQPEGDVLQFAAAFIAA